MATYRITVNQSYGQAVIYRNGRMLVHVSGNHYMAALHYALAFVRAARKARDLKYAQTTFEVTARFYD